ncbi:MAG TPA: KTSC domain-containing protein [Roseiflexaceae bacterium]|nr:KTSC domain-containing protein [Roseiflexaceae bacterium]
MERQPVDSRGLREVGYDPQRRELEVQFRDRKVYRYSEVPEEVYRALLAADSKGRYFNEQIKERYGYLRVG